MRVSFGRACNDAPRLILTQDADGAASWLARCQEAGLRALNWPAFRVHPVSDECVAGYFRSVCDALSAAPVSGKGSSDELAEPPSLTIIVLPSPAAVRVLADALQRQGLVWPEGVWAGVPGRGTADVFRQRFGHGIRLLCPPPPMQDAAHLALSLVDALRDEGVFLSARPAQRPSAPSSWKDEGMAGHEDSAAGSWHAGEAPVLAGPGGGAPGVRLAVFNRPDGRVDWLSTLAALGIRVSVHPVYQVKVCVSPPADMMAVLARCHRDGGVLHWVIGAGGPLRTVAGWLEGLPDELRAWGLQQPLWLPHPALAAEAHRLGFSRASVFRDRQSLIERLQSDDV